jgi:hypothetical protein
VLVGAYSFFDVMMSMIVFFAWVLVIAWVIMLMIDNFRRTDHSGWAKAAWFIFLIFLPVIGAISYTIARPKVETADVYGMDTAPSSGQSAAAQIARLDELKTKGAITDAEYDELKQKAIASA